jgi:hypothetical protein
MNSCPYGYYGWESLMHKSDFCELLRVVDSLTVYYTISLFDFHQHDKLHDTADPKKVIDHFLKLNKLGRRLIRDMNFSSTHVPLLLLKAVNDKKVDFI